MLSLRLLTLLLFSLRDSHINSFKIMDNLKKTHDKNIHSTQIDSHGIIFEKRDISRGQVPSEEIEGDLGNNAYNYENFLQEYYADSIQDYNISYHPKKKENSKKELFRWLKKMLFHTSDNRPIEATRNISSESIYSLFLDYICGKQSSIAIIAYVWRIIKIWCLIYLVIAIPLWCARGWCCCCLWCKFFKPRFSIEKAKKYVAINPPGVLNSSRNSEIFYEPTKREKERYEELRHLITTI